ncbi:MAG: hypothetical protein FWE20_07115 [Defluviitaleaceae bacterium]|nr:hypothetical protein [Defluviitaleaceae bacterium]
MRENTQILVQVDKTVVKITGLSVKGLNTSELENILRDRLGGLIRIIGVTGDSLEMDVYGLEEADILRDEDGLIKALASAEGITLSDVASLAAVKKVREVDINDVPDYVEGGCKAERWMDR